MLLHVLSNGLNHQDWPQVVSEDIQNHLERLRNRVVTLKGHAEGRTLLPLPLCLDRPQTQEIVLRSAFDYCGNQVRKCFGFFCCAVYSTFIEERVLCVRRVI